MYSVVVVRLFYWQVVKSSELKQMGINQSGEAIDIPAKRGDIISSDNYPFATTRVSYLLYANPKFIKNNSLKYANEISPLLNLDKEKVADLLSKDLYWVKLADNLDQNQKSAIEKLNVPGLGFQENDLRFYPEASMAAHLIGFLGRDKNGSGKGYFGLEGYYNDQLSGRAGKQYLIHDALGNPVLNDLREEKKIDGRSLVLNIDRTVQFIAEKKLKEGIEKYEAEGGSAIIMDPQSGRILAMASFPRFNPQKYYEFDYDTYRNPVIANLYEPGSTFKVLVMSAAIDLRVLKPDTKCNICSGPVTIGDYTVKTWNGKYYPDSTMAEVIQHSDNTGMVYVGKKLGLDNLTAYIKSFGIGQETQIDLEGEESARIRDKKDWYPIDLATASFGQGISVNPMQLLTAVSSIANGGNLIKPFVVSQIITEDGKKIDIKPQITRRVISEITAKIVTQMMVNAVENGEAKWTKLDNYKVAGKTGTAQIPIQGHYDPKETIASFVGFFPADNPKVSMLVLVHKPKTSIYGAETAAPIFFSIARDLVNYYSIPPTN
ncbi:MAG: hypothetical protein A2905_03045 [Candidatus Levybacteria bacterium RIFCSPLOWO2_01_FULL_36_10]|nr:MAG: hypothetical protein A2905_03045 [Candidatus Levybacteria bacterium RIFCSPLOWO2_01_FULL_36_10]